MREILLLVLLFVVGNWFVKALRRVNARTAQRPGADAAGGGHRPSGASGNGTAGNSASGTSGTAAGAAGAASRQLPEPMIRCAECGVHAPKSDSVVAGGDVFCSRDHAQRYAARTAQTRGRDGR